MIEVAAAAEFLAMESRLLDERRFEEWNELFTSDGVYWLPLEHPVSDYDPERAPSLIYDGPDRRRERVMRLSRTSPHCQTPSSETIHHVANICVDGNTVRSSLIVAEVRPGDQGQFGLGRQRMFAARCSYLLVPDAMNWKIQEKRLVLLDRRTPIANLSFIL